MKILFITLVFLGSLLSACTPKPSWQKAYEKLDPFDVNFGDIQTLELMLEQAEGTEATILAAELYLCRQSEKYQSAGEVLVCARDGLILKDKS